MRHGCRHENTKVGGDAERYTRCVRAKMVCVGDIGSRRGDEWLGFREGGVMQGPRARSRRSKHRYPCHETGVLIRRRRFGGKRIPGHHRLKFPDRPHTLSWARGVSDLFNRGGCDCAMVGCSWAQKVTNDAPRTYHRGVDLGAGLGLGLVLAPRVALRDGQALAGGVEAPRVVGTAAYTCRCIASHHVTSHKAPTSPTRSNRGTGGRGRRYRRRA